MYNLSFDKLMWRFYFMMAIVVGSFYIGIPWLAILSAPVLVSALAGYKFTLKGKTKANKKVILPSEQASGNFSTQF